MRDEDISQLKWFVLQHLPVLLQESMGTKSDSQLVNSVYLDNATLELYKCVVVWLLFFPPPNPFKHRYIHVKARHHGLDGSPPPPTLTPSPTTSPTRQGPPGQDAGGHRRALPLVRVGHPRARLRGAQDAPRGLDAGGVGQGALHGAGVGFCVFILAMHVRVGGVLTQSYICDPPLDAPQYPNTPQNHNPKLNQ